MVDEDDPDSSYGPVSDASGSFGEFDCPECNANNPVPDRFKGGDEVNCNYCGTTFMVKVRDNGRLKLRPT
jgi:DNA-directed RNA polymerase subunit RPC12/RpoP